MQVVPVLSAIFLASAVSVTVALVETTAFSPTNGVVNLEVTLAVEGDITWYSDSASTVSLVVTQTDDNPACFNDIIIDYTEDMESGTASLLIQSSKAGGASGWSGNLMVTLGVGLLVSLFMTRCSVSTVCLVLIGVLVAVSSLHASADDCTGRTDVAILVPRDFFFRSVVLTSRRGRIEVDETLLASGADLTCQSGADSTVCESCCQANGECVDGECQCRAEFEGNDCGTQTGTTYTLNNDPADPVIITLGSVEGEQLQVLGDKDGDGIASSVESLILDDGEGTTSFITLNQNNSLPERVSTSSGASIQYEWNDDLSSVHVTAVSPGGLFQVTINVNLNESVTDFKRDVNEIEEPLTNRKRQSDEEGVASVPVRVVQCDEPVADARVFALALLNYDEETMQWTGERLHRAVPTDTEGLFNIQLSTEEKPDNQPVVEEVCMEVVTILRGSCTILMAVSSQQEQAVCTAIRSSAELLGTALPRDLDIVNSACEGGFRALQLYCDNFGASATIDDTVCESASFAEDVTNFFETDTIFLEPYAEFPDGTRVDADGQVLNIEPGTSGVLPTSFTIQDDRAEPVITSLTVTPEDPDPQENYVVNVTYNCPTPTQSVNMSIVGTDNYTDFTVCAGLNFSCSLFVPGAEQLVVDRVTVAISDLLGAFFFIREVVVVF